MYGLFIIPYLIIIGDKEEERKEVSVRTREGQDLGSITLEGLKSILDSSLSLKGKTL